MVPRHPARTVFFRRQGGDAMNDHTIMGIVQEDGSFELVSGFRAKALRPASTMS